MGSAETADLLLLIRLRDGNSTMLMGPQSHQSSGLRVLQRRMPTIPYRAANFSGAFAQLNTNNTEISVAWAQLVWAAITAGKAAGDEYAYGIYSTLERLHRASMIRAYLMQTASGHIVRTMPYRLSDPSEKTSISFYLGMTLAKLFAELLFDVPRMLHFAVYAPNYQIVAAPGESRPDLIGLSNTGEWFVFEAKGRSNNFDPDALGTAKEQAEQIQLIDNLIPACSVACQAYFTSVLRFRMDDPPPRKSDRPRTIKISQADFRHAYDGPIRSVIELRGANATLSYANRRFRGARVEEADLWIGAPEADQTTLVKSEADPITHDEYLGGDDVLVRLGPTWSEANMRLQPHLRNT